MSLLDTPLSLALLAMVGAGTALALLGVLVHVTERRDAEQRRRASHVPASNRSERPARHGHLSAKELYRLSAFRSQARLMAGEPLRAVRWWQRIRLAWREGYAGWVVACLAGSFSMATHFGAYWLITGGGWPGAIMITLLSTGVMVGACAWIGLGLISGQ